MNYLPNDLVKSCPKLESGLRLGIEGIHACQLGPFSSPLFWTAEDASRMSIRKDMIVEKRRQLFQALNDENEDVICKRCRMVRTKRYAEVDFTKLGRIDYAATTICNLRCNFCGNTAQNAFHKSRYDALAILREFSAKDVEWDSIVDFNGGEPTLLPNFDEHLDLFASLRIRVLLYTNGVKYHQSVYDGLANGTVFWACTSLDCGTPSSFLRMKKRDYFLRVLETVTRYARAGNQGGGMFAAKYIFCSDNCGDDDISGFVYAMLAVRPQKIWLTFDFTPFGNLSPDFVGPDYSRQISAYVKMYNMLKKHGITATHYTEGHLAMICQQGKNLLNQVLSEIDKSASSTGSNTTLLAVGQEGENPSPRPEYFMTQPLRTRMPDGNSEPFSIAGKRIVLAPACPSSVRLLTEPEIGGERIVGFLDRDPCLRGKSIEGIPIHGYNAIPDLDPEVILIASPSQHQADILHQIAGFANKNMRVASLSQEGK